MTPPTWLTPWAPYLAAAVATLALIVAVVSLWTARQSKRIAKDTFKRAGPQTTAWFAVAVESTGSAEPISAHLFAVVRNVGLSSTNVENMALRHYSGDDRQLEYRLKGPSFEQLDGNPLPASIASNAAGRWHFRIDALRLSSGEIIRGGKNIRNALSRTELTVYSTKGSVKYRYRGLSMSVRSIEDFYSDILWYSRLDR